MNEETLKEIDERVNDGSETEEDIQILTDRFEAFMDELK